jgi:hypothetical protein
MVSEANQRRECNVRIMRLRKKETQEVTYPKRAKFFSQKGQVEAKAP